MLYTTFLKRVFHVVHGPTPDRPPGDDRSGLILICDGVGGLDLCGTALIHVAAQAHSSYEVRIVPWGHGFGRWHRDLTNVENHRHWAGRIVEEVAAFHSQRPLAPIFLVGKSGGTGVVVRALEGMPEGSVEAVVLLSSALSPEYDLSKALKAVRRDLTLFWSPLDVIVLGAGTSIFGTIDRRRDVSAGLVGFRQPDGLDDAARSQYAKLKQVRWSPKMASTGYLGGHIGPDTPAFLRKYILPLVGVAIEATDAAGRESSSHTDAPIT